MYTFVGVDTEDATGPQPLKAPRPNQPVWQTNSMKPPFIRVTKWLGNIPIEAECTRCPGTKFRASSTSHRPNREDYQQSLQRDFDLHVKTIHAREDDPPAQPS